MVKASPRLTRKELIDQVNALASQFAGTVGVGSTAQAPLGRSDDDVMHDDGRSSPDADPGTSGAATTSAAGAALPPPDERPVKYTTLGFEVDFTGSQLSDTPFLRPLSYARAKLRPPAIGLDARAPRFKRPAPRKRDEAPAGRCARASDGHYVCTLVFAARERVLASLAEMVPGSIRDIESLDLSGGAGTGRLRWALVKRWLEERPELMARMNLTARALRLIATFDDHATGPPCYHVIRHHGRMIRKWDADNYRELRSFCFSADDPGKVDDAARLG